MLVGGQASEREALFVESLLTSDDLRDNQAGAWAMAKLSCNGSTRLLFGMEETTYIRSFFSLIARTNDIEVWRESSRALNNLSATGTALEVSSCAE